MDSRQLAGMPRAHAELSDPDGGLSVVMPFQHLVPLYVRGLVGLLYVRRILRVLGARLGNSLARFMRSPIVSIVCS